MMNLFFRYPRTHIRLAVVLTLSLLFCISNVQAMYARLMNKTPVINNPQNHEIEVELMEAQRDLLSPILNDGKSSLCPIILFYLDANDLRKSNMVCKTFYNIIHAKTFLEARAEFEFQKTFENYFQKFNPQIEKIGPYEIKMTIQHEKNYFDLDKFESEMFYFPFSLTYHFKLYAEHHNHFHAIFLPSKNIQENYLSPFGEMPERHIPFNSNLSLSAFPARLRNNNIRADLKLVKMTYKINFENMNQLFETYSENEYPVKHRQIWRKRKLALFWTMWSGLVAFNCFMWYMTVDLKNFGVVFFGIFAFLWTGLVLFYLKILLTLTFVKLPNDKRHNCLN